MNTANFLARLAIIICLWGIENQLARIASALLK